MWRFDINELLLHDFRRQHLQYINICYSSAAKIDLEDSNVDAILAACIKEGISRASVAELARVAPSYRHRRSNISSCGYGRRWRRRCYAHSKLRRCLAVHYKNAFVTRLQRVLLAHRNESRPLLTMLAVRPQSIQHSTSNARLSLPGSARRTASERNLSEQVARKDRTDARSSSPPLAVNARLNCHR